MGVTVCVSKNAKVGTCVATYLPIAETCADARVACPLKDGRCYALGGRVGMHQRRLGGQSLESIHAEHRDRIVAMSHTHGDMPLRVCVSGSPASGDTGTAMALGAIVERHWRGPAWTYTHAWKAIPRASWGRKLSILASVESHAGAVRALARGYAPARIVPEHVSPRAWTEGSVTYIPCPEQTLGRACVLCRLCWDSDRLARSRAAITFAAHGTGKKRTLNVIR